MKTRLMLTAAATVLAGAAAAQTVPEGYPADYAAKIEAAKAEGKMLIYTNLSESNIGPVVKAFEAAYPGVDVESVEMGPAEAFTRYAAETGTGIASADMVIANSIADWIVATEDGILAPYASPELANVPGWSHPADGLYTFSTDPMVTIYNKLTVPEELQVSGMQEYFAAIAAHPEVFDRKVGTYDGRFAFGGSIGFAFVKHHGDQAWGWFEAAGPHVIAGGGAGGMVEKVLSGEFNSSFFVSAPVVWNSLASGTGELLGWTFPSDGTPVFLRGMAITAKAPHPAAAELFLDFVLSEAGQKAVAAGNLTPYRPGVEAEGEFAYSLDEVLEAIGGESKMILVDYDPDYVKTMDEFSARWGAAFHM